MSDRRRTPAGQRGLPLAEGDWGLLVGDESADDAASAETSVPSVEKPGAEDPPERSLLSGSQRLPDGTPAGEFDDLLGSAKLTLGDALVRFRRMANLHDNAPDGALIIFAWGAGNQRAGAQWVRECAAELDRLRVYDQQAREDQADVIRSDRLS